MTRRKESKASINRRDVMAGVAAAVIPADAQPSWLGHARNAIRPAGQPNGAELFPDFKHFGMRTSGATIRQRRGHRCDAMQCGHYIAEEMPDHVYNRFVEFFKA